MLAKILFPARSVCRAYVTPLRMWVIVGTLALYEHLGCGLLAQDEQAPVHRRSAGQPLPWSQRVSVDFHNVSLVQVAEELETTVGLRIIINHKALEDAGIAPDRGITLKLRDVTVEALLDLLCETNDLDYHLRDRFIVLTTPTDAQQHSATRVYPVADLIDYLVQTHLRTPNSKLGDNATFFGGAGLTASPDTPTTYHSQARDELILTLQAHVNPDSWDVNGGASSCSLFGDLLIVRTTERGHHAVRAMLKNLRRNIQAGQRQ